MIKVEGVSKKVTSNEILSNINFTLDSNGVVAVVGPSGSGKTTLLRILAGLEECETGRVTLNDIVVNDPAILISPQNRKVGFVFQDLALWPHMKAAEHINFVREGADDCLTNAEAFRLARFPAEKSNSYPHQLSGGEKQRLAIARAIVRKPAVLLMDEPLSNLDELIKWQILDEMTKLNAELGVPIIYVTHSTQEVRRLQSKVLVLQGGRVSYFGEQRDIPSSDNEFLELLRTSI
ncbi:ABC transporter ATP-binding protein [candidate division WWE3 bacterium]|uniref:ABC transporter ATP-binding protein n=1 Tax=candidate division WWE3 bacterium TaxID=2053526 RepID=A0A955LL33_UNCKA|nr:ABC transporter ATP-binding protein [candidate division WWE3 bacterium]